MAFSATDVKNLREMTGVGMMDCKKALVATDIAARGIDIEELSHVFNYNLPEVPETYVHRIGRTGRAKRQGVAVSLIADYPSKMRVDDIAQKTRNEIVPVKFGEDGKLEVLG